MDKTKEIIYDFYYNDEFFYMCKVVSSNIKLTPLKATRIEPEIKLGYWPRFNEDTASWEQVENHIGTYGWLDKQEIEITNYGPLPEGFTLEKPEETPEEAKIRAIYLLKEKRKSVEQGNIKLAGYVFQTDLKDEVRLGRLEVSFTKDPTHIEMWVTNDGVVPMNVQLFMQLTIAFETHIRNSFAVQYNKNYEIGNLETVQEINEWLSTELNTDWTTEY